MRMKFYPWVSCLERLYRFTLAGGVRLPWVSCLESLYRTLLAGECPPLQRLGALRGRSPCFACPVRPRGRLPLGLVIEGAGRWLASRASSPQSGVYEDGLVLSFVRSLPEFGVGKVLQVKNGWRIRSGTANTPPKHTTLHKTMQSARNQPSRKVPVTSIAHHGRRRQKNGSL